MSTNPPPSTAPPEERKAYLTAHPPPPPIPAYLPSAGGRSPLEVDRQLYERIRSAKRTLLSRHDVPMRSGQAFFAPAGSIIVRLPCHPMLLPQHSHTARSIHYPPFTITSPQSSTSPP
jgi:hypothetical protein